MKDGKEMVKVELSSGEEEEIELEIPKENAEYEKKNQELLREYVATGNMDVRNQIVELNFPLVHSIVQDFLSKNASLSYDDLFAEGSYGLMKAVDNYNPERGKNASFSTIAYPYIKNAILAYLLESGRFITLPRNILTRLKRISSVREGLQAKLKRNPTDQEIVTAFNESEKELVKAKLLNRLGRLPTKEEIEKEMKGKRLDMHSLFDTLLYDSKVTSYDSVTPSNGENENMRVCDSVADTTQDPVGDFEAKNITESLGDVMDRVLDEQEKDILLSRNGSSEQVMTLAELAEKYHLSKERIRQIENQAKEKVRKAYQKDN